jgi:hypothetical protein
MNKPLIDQLVAQSSHDILGVSILDRYAFTKLIVSECCSMMLDLETKYPANLTVKEIKQHFGIE